MNGSAEEKPPLSLSSWLIHKLTEAPSSPCWVGHGKSFLDEAPAPAWLVTPSLPVAFQPQLLPLPQPPLGIKCPALNEAASCMLLVASQWVSVNSPLQPAPLPSFAPPACDHCLRALETAEENAQRLLGKPQALPHPDQCSIRKDLHQHCPGCQVSGSRGQRGPPSGVPSADSVGLVAGHPQVCFSDAAFSVIRRRLQSERLWL